MAKVRVYELAKELGLESKELLSKLQEVGEFVRSASSTVEAPVVRKLMDKFPDLVPAEAAPKAKKAPAKNVPAKKAPAERPKFLTKAEIEARKAALAAELQKEIDAKKYENNLKKVKEFDKEYKRITDLRNEIEKQLEKSIQLRGIDKEASYAAGQQAIALAGTNSVLGNMLNKGNVDGALKLLDSGLTVDFKVKEFKQKEEDAWAIYGCTSYKYVSAKALSLNFSSFQADL